MHIYRICMARVVTQEGAFQFKLQYRCQPEGSLYEETLVHYSDPDAMKNSHIYYGTTINTNINMEQTDRNVKHVGITGSADSIST
jgi:hypothetical protein